MNEQEQASPSLVVPSAPSVSYPWRKEPEIDVERQATLAKCLARVPNVKKECYPFLGEKLSRADIEWLLVTHENGKGPVDWGDEKQRHRKGLDLRGADLRQVDLCDLPLGCFSGGLTREEWQRTTLRQRDRAGVNLEGADLSGAHLEGAILEGAHLYGATLRGTFLQKANLFRADLRSTYLREVHWEQANLRGTRLEGAYLPNAHLQGADLRNAFFDGASNLEGITLSDEKDGTAVMADVSWGNANLALVDWSRITRLGDENKAHQLRTGRGTVKGRGKQLEDYRAAVRATRQLANAMRAQGMNEEAIPFAYRAQALQRKVLWRQVLWGEVEAPQQRTLLRDIGSRLRKLAALIFSYFLDAIAGYGYKPGRTAFIYLVVIAAFAVCYDTIGHLIPAEALIFSITSFHGRGFLPGPFTLGSPVTALAATEAVMGLFIEISFIATFTQRFFGR
ncbi:MAG: pentapeptide repeat-containing protein [Ktedonobacteraceae bacterium]